jgi:hypothetical protein
VTPDVIDVLALEEFEAEWGVVDLGRLARWARQVRDRDGVSRRREGSVTSGRTGVVT